MAAVQAPAVGDLPGLVRGLATHKDEVGDESEDGAWSEDEETTVRVLVHVYGSRFGARDIFAFSASGETPHPLLLSRSVAYESSTLNKQSRRPKPTSKHCSMGNLTHARRCKSRMGDLGSRPHGRELAAKHERVRVLLQKGLLVGDTWRREPALVEKLLAANGAYKIAGGRPADAGHDARDVLHSIACVAKNWRNKIEERQLRAARLVIG